MSLPTAATKTHLDAASDDPKQARAELAALVDTVNALLTHLGLSTVTSTPLTLGEGLEADSGAARVKLDGATLVRSASGLKLASPVAVANGGTGAGTAAGARANLGLGTAATKAAGTGAGEVLLLADAAKLPALDGSQLTDLPLNVVQVVRASSGAVGTTTSVVPNDNTKPVASEGAQFLSAAITPQAAGNLLLVQVTLNARTSNDVGFAVSLFWNGSAISIGSVAMQDFDDEKCSYPATFSAEFEAPSTAEVTFTVRAGPLGTATLTVNGVNGAGRFDGVMASSITIWELTP